MLAHKKVQYTQHLCLFQSFIAIKYTHIKYTKNKDTCLQDTMKSITTYFNQTKQ